MVQTIGFIGCGNLNFVIAQLAVNAGFQVIVSNARGPASLANIVAKLGPLARAGTIEEAARQSDLVSVSIPFDKLELLPAAPFTAKTVIDTMNYHAMKSGRVEELENRTLTSSEYVQRHLKGSRVVKLFNTIDQLHLTGARPAGNPARWALPMAGDNAEAKVQVAAFADAIGFDAVDYGMLADSWRSQPCTPVFILSYIGTVPEGLSKTELLQWGLQDHTKIVKPAEVLRLVAEATVSTPVSGSFDDFPLAYFEAID